MCDDQIRRTLCQRGTVGERKRNISARQDRRVVETIANHRDASSIVLQATHEREFVFGSLSRMHIVDAQRVGNSCNRFCAVTAG